MATTSTKASGSGQKRKRTSSSKSGAVNLSSLKSAVEALSASFDPPVPILESGTLTFMDRLGAGGFGCVYEGKTEDGDEVAIKTVAVKSEEDLSDFCDEARAAWAACNGLPVSASFSPICQTLGVSYSLSPAGSPRCHRIMERLDVEGDLHDVIHDPANWDDEPSRIKPKTYA